MKANEDTSQSGTFFSGNRLNGCFACRLNRDPLTSSPRITAELARTEAQLGAPGEDHVTQLRETKAALETAKLNLEFTEVRASVDGYVTNLALRLGSQAVANQPALALMDTSSFCARGFFRENAVEHVQPGMPAVVTLMT